MLSFVDDLQTFPKSFQDKEMLLTIVTDAQIDWLIDWLKSETP